MTRKPARRLPSGLIEGSAAANRAEAAELARLDALLGITPATKARRAAAPRGKATAFGAAVRAASTTR